MAKLPNRFWKATEEVYSRGEDGKRNWAEESGPLREILPKIQRDLEDAYEIVGPIARGGTALVLQAIDLRLSPKNGRGAQDPTYRAVKVPRPIGSRQDLFIDVLSKEVGFLSSLTHTNLIKLYAFGSVDALDRDYPYYVMDYVHDAKSPIDFISRPEVDREDLFRILTEIIEGFCYLADNGVIHNDPKPANVLVDVEGRAIISDLGSAKLVNGDENETTIMFTRHYACRDKIARARAETTSEDRIKLSILPSEVDAHWDLHALGLTFAEILQAFCDHHPDGICVYDRLYLSLLVGRMLGRCVREDETVLGWPRAVYEELEYKSVQEVREDLFKVAGKYDLSREVPELDLDSKRVIQCPMSGVVPWTDRLSKVLKHPAVKRLASITQLGLLNYIYPNATHTRYEHSLGCYGNAVRMLRALWADKRNPVFRQIMTARDLEACLLAVLLHDIGQYPLAHDLEEADRELFSHENLTRVFLSRDIPGFLSPLASKLDELWGEGTASRVESILRAKPDNFKYPFKDRILHSIVDGPIDADKLDYIYRDSTRLRVPYGLALDFERIIGSMTVVHEPQGNDLYAMVGIHEKGRIGAESVAFARYALFAAAYWHHTSRAIKAMIHRAVWEATSVPERRTRVSFGKQLRRLVLRNELPAIQRALFDPETEFDKSAWPGMAQTDMQVLIWIRGITSEAGKFLIDHLLNRDLYKRALVITKEHDKGLTRRITRIIQGGVADIIRFHYRLRDELARHLEELPAEHRRDTTALDPEATASFGERARKGEPLVLIDVPGAATSGMRELRCVPEAERWSTYLDAQGAKKMEDSPVWTSFVDSFEGGAGKMRVFVHPDFSSTVRALSRVALMGVLNACVTQLTP